MAESEIGDSIEPASSAQEAAAGKVSAAVLKQLPIYSILDSIDFTRHFILLGDVGTGKSTVVPIHEFEASGKSKRIIIREPSRATCNALYYSLVALHPWIKDDLAVVTKDTKINVAGMVRIVSDGVLLRMLAEGSVAGNSIYFDESHLMSSQLELCMSLAKKEEHSTKNLFRVMSATIDPHEFLSFFGITRLHSITGRRFPVKLEVEMVRNLDEMYNTLYRYLYAQPRNESWLVFHPTRKLVEKVASSFGGVYIHGGLDGSEINKIQRRAEQEKNLKVFATNVIASSVNIQVDNVLIFNDTIDSKDRLGQKTLKYDKIDNNTLLQMMGRIGRFRPGRAVVLTDTPVPRSLDPVPVWKSLVTETPFDHVLLMSKYGLKFSDLEFMSRVNHREVSFAEDWLASVGAIEPRTHKITKKGLLMSEIPYDSDFAHMIASALIYGDRQLARFLLAAGAFGDSLNLAYKSDHEPAAREFLYGFDMTNELNIKAHLLKRFVEDADGTFAPRLAKNGIFHRYVEEAAKSYEAARDSLNDLLEASKEELIPPEVVADPDPLLLESYLADCLSFERFELYQRREFDLRNLYIESHFYARSVTVNFRKILFDVVAPPGGRRGRYRRRR